MAFKKHTITEPTLVRDWYAKTDHGWEIEIQPGTEVLRERDCVIYTEPDTGKRLKCVAV